MIVYGTLRKNDESGNIIYSGSFDQCRQYAYGLDYSLFYDLAICEDNGIIKERVVRPENRSI